MRRRSGFTLIEVTLTLALTALICIAFIASISTPIARQRYNDSVQDFTEFIRSQYSAVLNVQNSGLGNTKQAIYGRLITFGEDDSGVIRTYDIVGDAYTSNQLIGNKSILFALKTVQATVFEQSETMGCTLIPVNESYYRLTYEAWLEFPPAERGTDTRFRGSIMIVRSPVSGLVSTIYSRDIIQVQDNIGKSCSAAIDPLGTSPSTPSPSVLDSFTTQEINFCIGSDFQPAVDVRRDVRISSGASNSADVQIIDQESGDNKCNG